MNITSPNKTPNNITAPGLGAFARSNMYTEAATKEPNATPNGKV